MSNTITPTTVQPLVYEPLNSKRPVTGEAGGGGFEDALRNAIGQMEGLQADSEQQVASLLQGERGDVHNVMMAVEKADVAFQLMMQVRNKIVNAYQQVSQMQF